MMGPARVGWLGAAVMALAACGSSTPEEFATGEVIPDCGPVGSPLSVGETMEYMAGRYRVVMVRDGGKEQAFGVVDMERTPEAYRDWGPSTATLTGSAQIDFEAVGAQTLSGLDSTDPARPGALVLEAPGSSGPSIVLRFGSNANDPNITPFDGAFTALNIRVVEGDRFAGDWRSGVSGVIVEGYFCAQRIDR